MDAWPFLVARARAAESQVVVAPKWAVEAGNYEVLGLAAGARQPPAGTVVVRDLVGFPDGTWSIAYRVSLPTAAEYGLGDADSLRDNSGRPIRLVEGLVLRNSAHEGAARGLGEADLRHLRDVLVPAYRSFWFADSRQPVTPSNRLDLVPVQPQDAVPLEVEEPYVLPFGLPGAPSADVKESRAGVGEPLSADGVLALPPTLGIVALVLLAVSGLLWFVFAVVGGGFGRASAEITNPGPKAKVERSIVVEGRSRNMQGEKIWIVTLAPDRLYYLNRSPATVRGDGRWRAPDVTVGNKDSESGDSFTLIAISADEQLSEDLESGVGQSQENDVLPKGHNELDRVTVFRQ